MDTSNVHLFQEGLLGPELLNIGMHIGERFEPEFRLLAKTPMQYTAMFTPVKKQFSVECF